MNLFFFAMLVFVPVTLVAAVLHVSPLILFILSALAIVPLAKYIGEATEELTYYTGPGIGGLLNATFGNITEFSISIFALHAGLIEVIKASIAGSIIGNLLLVLGSAIFLGGINRERQQFNKTAAAAATNTLLLAVIALVIPSIFAGTLATTETWPIQEVSVAVAVLMILAYIASLIFSLHTHKHLYAEAEGGEKATWSKTKSILVLLSSTIAVAAMSEILVDSIEPLVRNFGWSEIFIGVIFVAIIGNAAEHVSAITFAIKNKMDLALNIAIGSATQIVMLVAPALVLISLFFAQPMNLIFNMFELVAIIFSVFIASAIVVDGESNWFEGVQLLIAYTIMAVAFFFH